MSAWCVGRAGVLALGPSPKRPFLHTSLSRFFLPSTPLPLPTPSLKPPPGKPTSASHDWHPDSSLTVPVHHPLSSVNAATITACRDLRVTIHERSNKRTHDGRTHLANRCPYGLGSFLHDKNLAYGLRLPFLLNDFPDPGTLRVETSGERACSKRSAFWMFSFPSPPPSVVCSPGNVNVDQTTGRQDNFNGFNYMYFQNVHSVLWWRQDKLGFAF